MFIAATFNSWQQHHFTVFLSFLQSTSHAEIFLILMVSAFSLLWALTSAVAVFEFLLNLHLLGVPRQFLLGRWWRYHLSIGAMVARGHRGSGRCSHPVQFPVLQVLLMMRRMVVALLYSRRAPSCASWALAWPFDDFLLWERNDVRRFIDIVFVIDVVLGGGWRAGRVLLLLWMIFISLLASAVVCGVALADQVQVDARLWRPGAMTLINYAVFLVVSGGGASTVLLLSFSSWVVRCPCDSSCICPRILTAESEKATDSGLKWMMIIIDLVAVLRSGWFSVSVFR